MIVLTTDDRFQIDDHFLMGDHFGWMIAFMTDDHSLSVSGKGSIITPCPMNNKKGPPNSAE